MAEVPRVAFTGTLNALWPATTLTAKEVVTHATLLPITRMACERKILVELLEACAKRGIPLNTVRSTGTWHEDISVDTETGDMTYMLTLDTKSIMWAAQQRLEEAAAPGTARWIGGPRAGEEIVAVNGELVWDGPLGVFVQDEKLMWRDVGEGMREAWALMTPDARVAYRLEIEAEAGVTYSVDMETALRPGPPKWIM